MLGLSNIAFSSSDCMSNDNMILSTSSELENAWKKAVMSCHVSQSVGQDSNPGPPKYEETAQLT